MTDYTQGMSAVLIRLLLLISMTLMPLGMTPATAAAPNHQATAGLPMEHCPDPAPAHDDKGTFGACTMACSAALPAVERDNDRRAPRARGPVEALPLPLLHGLHPETATPPPKLA